VSGECVKKSVPSTPLIIDSILNPEQIMIKITKKNYDPKRYSKLI
jgi:hypothetical protein